MSCFNPSDRQPMKPTSNDKTSHKDGKTPRPAWLLPVAAGLGLAVGISVLGSLLLLGVWFFTADRAATEIAANDEATSNAFAQAPSEAPSPTPPAIETPADDTAAREPTAVEIAAVPPAQPETNEDTSSETPPVEQRPSPKPIRFEDVPVIGGTPETPDAAEELTASEEKPEKLDLPFLVLGCAPSTDGRHVVAWGYDSRDEAPVLGTPRSGDQRPPDSRLALLEVGTWKVLVSRSIAAVITQVDFNATGVYVAANEGTNKYEMSVLRLSTKDLESLDRGTVLSGTINSIADQFLISQRPDYGGSRKYLLPSLQPADSDTEQNNVRTRSAPALRLADGWLLDGVLWDDDLKSPKLLLSPADFLPVPMNRSRAGGIIVVPILQGYVTHVASGRPPSDRDWRVERPRLSPHVPAVLAFSNIRGKTSLDFFEHYTGKVLRSVELKSGTPRIAQLVTTPDWIFATLDDDTFMLPTQSKQDPIAVPFRIEPQQSVVALSPDAPVQVRYQAPDATKFEFELPALTINGEAFKEQSPTGEFTIDAAADASSIVKTMNDSATKDRRAYSGDVAAWAETYVNQIRPQFVRLTGREPAGVPLALDAYVRAYGKDLSVAVLQHVYLIEIPLAEFEQYRRPAPTPLAAVPKPSPPPAAAQPKPQPAPAAADPSAALRTWTDTSGRTIEAKFVQVDGEVAVVIDSRGRTLRIPLDRLSEQDRAWLAEQAATQDQPPGDEP